jgi:hypothetical protein
MADEETMLDCEQEHHGGRYRITPARGAVQRSGADPGGCVRADDRFPRHHPHVRRGKKGRHSRQQPETSWAFASMATHPRDRAGCSLILNRIVPEHAARERQIMGAISTITTLNSRKGN